MKEDIALGALEESKPRMLSRFCRKFPLKSEKSKKNIKNEAYLGVFNNSSKSNGCNLYYESDEDSIQVRNNKEDSYGDNSF